MVVLGLEARPDGSPKDTSRNIRLNREFVVNIVDYAAAEKMNLCATPLEPGESEIPLAGFTTAPSTLVAPPRLTELPAALECFRHTTLELGNLREIVVGEVRAIALRDDVIDVTNLHVDAAKLDTIGRLGSNLYASSRDQFALDRPDGR
jgi:flavin reductase (DIM6/NTAB) family NADH-FMN oxidoreductase RutF